MIYKLARHTGGLKEMLETEKEITEKIAIELIKKKKYKLYCYDERIKAFRYIKTNFKNNQPTWLNVYETMSSKNKKK